MHLSSICNQDGEAYSCFDVLVLQLFCKKNNNTILQISGNLYISEQFVLQTIISKDKISSSEQRRMTGSYHFLYVVVLWLPLHIVWIGSVSRKLELILQVKGEPAGLMPAYRNNKVTLQTFYTPELKKMLQNVCFV